MSQAEVISTFFRRNTQAIGFEENEVGKHGLTVKLDRFDVDEESLRFESEDFPYFRAALLDKYLEETDAEKQSI